MLCYAKMLCYVCTIYLKKKQKKLFVKRMTLFRKLKQKKNKNERKKESRKERPVSKLSNVKKSYKHVLSFLSSCVVVIVVVVVVVVLTNEIVYK